MNLPLASYKIIYNNTNITKDIGDSLISLKYIDKVEGESDELEITLEDKDLKWQNGWYPRKGAKLTAQIESNGLTLNCGAFSIDEIELSADAGSGDVVTVKGLAAFITKKIRTKISTAHENKSFREIANTIAARNGLTVQGNIKDIRIQRITQYRQSDLGFLKNLAADFGYIFSVRDTKIIFTDIYELESKAGVLSIDKTELTSYKIIDKSADTYKRSRVKHHNPKTKELEEYTQESDGDEFEKDDDLELRMKAENKQQAELKARSHLHKKNSKEKAGSITGPGNVLLLSGNNFELTGCGTLSGKMHVIQSTHTLSRDKQYTTECDIKRVATIAASKHLPKKIKKETFNLANIEAQFNNGQ